MSTIQKQIETLLQDEALSHSLSTEALERMLRELDTLKKQVERLTEQCNKDKIYKKEQEGIRVTLHNSLEDYRTQESNLANRESAVKHMEHTQLRDTMALEYEQIRVGDHKEVLSLILRNASINKTITGMVPVPVDGMAASTDQYGNHNPGFPGSVENAVVSSNSNEEKS